jgi:hypothetical protein
LHGLDDCTAEVFMRRWLALAVAASSIAPAALAREKDEEDLAREAADPVSNLSSIPIQNEVDFGVGPHDRTRNTLAVQPTYGFMLTRDVGIVSRTKVPIVSEPLATQRPAWTSGLGDVTEALFVAPTAGTSGALLWGIGPTLLLPTATESALGTGKLGLGPIGAVLVQPKPWTFGVLVAQVWSVAGAPERPSISQLGVMPLVTFHFSRGWYLTTAPNITANWNARAPRDVWTIPIGGGAGRVFFAQSLPINVSVGAYWNAIRPDAAASVSAQVQIAVLFPR